VVLLGKTAGITAQHHILQDGSPQHQCCENFNSHSIVALFPQGTRNLGLTLCILSIKFYFLFMLYFLFIFLFFILFSSGNREDCVGWNIASCPDNYL
jgi:hypothetical protein